MREQKIVDHAHPVAEIGVWLWALEDARRRTNEEIAQLSEAMIDWQPPHCDSTIGSVLYHVALIEADWLYDEVLGLDAYPEPASSLLPHPHRTKQGLLTPVFGETIAHHSARLAKIRELLLETFNEMSLAEFLRPRELERYIVTPEWVLHHLCQHEAEHRSQIGGLRIAFERAHGIETS
ncbi:DinB family protein [Herpetosiphon giganteus]|uniref:DinB family protein n=1 Tax=Herpetosiphon giganteus TaxID=2029754 RepID=UPI00195EFCE0|nr:DinB family protein [Herpetosiphon giganteus]MBM7846410.1 putative damage-inducible protein DinB [Herpetosiphon giganteus]